VTTTPKSGCTFVNWTENSAVVSSSASNTFALSANRKLVANFSAGTPITLEENTVLSGGDSGNGNLLVVQDATLAQNGTIRSLSFYVNGQTTSPSGNLVLGVYDATGALKAQTASFAPVVGWNTQNVITPVSLTAGNYWLAYFPSSNNLAFNVASGGTYWGIGQTFGPMPATFPAGASPGTAHWSLYATLTTP
jgi:Divergent InlB B-repeat domain